MSGYEPPFHMTNHIIDLLMQISEQLGRITVLQPQSITPHLRKENRIRTIHSSLAIEHNSLTKEQVAAIINGTRVLGNPNEIKEVQNAYQAYEMMLQVIKDTLVDYEDKTDQVGDQETDQVIINNSNVIKLLDILSENTMSAKELMDELGLSHRPTFRNNYLNPALELGVIERTIPDKPNSRNQRYRKTAK